MKKLLVVLALMGISYSAFAGGARKFDSNAISLVNQLQQCPADYSKIVNAGWILLSAADADSSGLEASYHDLRLVFGKQEPVPSMMKQAKAILTITKTAKNSEQNPAPDAPTKWSTKCQLQVAQ